MLTPVFRRALCIGMLLASLVWLVSPEPAFAQVPSQIPFQGLLLDSGGAPLTGAVDLDFELFDDLVTGTSLWSEAQPGVMVVDGVYSVTLGANSPVGPGVVASGNAFLAITVDGETLTPRQQLLSVPYSLRSAEADNVGNIPSLFFAQMIQSFPFDGAEPGNMDPSEGTGDADLDGIPNFLDPDNDNDGLLDGDEFAAGTSINLETPSITNVATTGPVISYLPNVLTVTGTNFDTLSSVTFGPETPSLEQQTSTGFEITVTPNELSPAFSVQVTLANGETASSAAIPIINTTPVIDSVAPPFIGVAPGSFVITGSGFLPNVTVQFGDEMITPTEISATSLTVPYGPQTFGAKQLIVFHPNGLDSGLRNYNVADPFPARTVFVTAGLYDGDLGGLAGADAICQAEADAQSLPGTYFAWLSDSTGSPSTRFNQQGGFFRVDGEPVAYSWPDLIDGVIENPINLVAQGTGFSGVAQVWSGTNTDGTAVQGGSSSCLNWTSSSSGGAPIAVANNSTNWGGFPSFLLSCSAQIRLYCFEQ